MSSLSINTSSSSVPYDSRWQKEAMISSLRESLNFHHLPGHHTVESPVVGTRAEELMTVKKAMRKYPVLASLQKSIYSIDNIYLIPLDKKDEADEFARELFVKYISKYAHFGCTEQNIVEWVASGYPFAATNKTHIYDIENEWNTWCLHVLIENRNGECNQKGDRYLPPHIVAYHEVMHVEEIPPLAKEAIQNENGIELLTTIKTFILLDTVYKKIHQYAENSEVDYGKEIQLINGKKIKLGAFANFYREQEKRLGKLYLALISPESIAFLDSMDTPKQGRRCCFSIALAVGILSVSMAIISMNLCR